MSFMWTYLKVKGKEEAGEINANVEVDGLG
jgi:hypothetical protein